MGWFEVVSGHWAESRSWAMLPFDRARTTSYSTLVETMRLSCIVFEIERSVCRKSPILTHQPAVGGPVRFDSGRMSLRSLAPENWSPWAIVLCCLRDPYSLAVLVEHPTCDRHRQTQTDTDTGP